MVLEVFGLPGQRFTSHPEQDQMKFIFKNEKDAGAVNTMTVALPSSILTIQKKLSKSVANFGCKEK
jgi:L-rhamnose isomerase